MEVLPAIEPQTEETPKIELPQLPTKSNTDKTSQSTSKKGRPRKPKKAEDDKGRGRPPNSEEPKKRKKVKVEKVLAEVQGNIQTEGVQAEPQEQLVIEDELSMWREKGEQIKNLHAQLSELTSEMAKKFKDKKQFPTTQHIVKELRKFDKKFSKVDQMIKNPIQRELAQPQDQPQPEQNEQNTENKIELEPYVPTETKVDQVVEQVVEKREEITEQEQVNSPPPPPPVVPTTPKTDEKKKKSNNTSITGWLQISKRTINKPTGLFKNSGSRIQKEVSADIISNLDRYLEGNSLVDDITIALHSRMEPQTDRIQEECKRRVFLKLHDSQIVWKGEKFNKTSDQINGRRPFGLDKYHIDYEIESEEEMDAESIKSKGDDDEEDDISEEDSLSQVKIVEDGHLSADELMQESDPHHPKLLPRIDKTDYFQEDGNTKQYSYFAKTCKPETLNLYAMQLLDDTKTYPLFKKTFFSDRLHMVQFIKSLHGSFISQINFLNEIMKDFPECPRQEAEKKLKQIADKQKFEYSQGSKDRWIVRPEILKEYNFTEEYAITLMSDRETAFLTQKQQKQEKKRLEQSDKKKLQDETMEKYLKQQAQLQPTQFQQEPQQSPIMEQTQPQQPQQPPPQ